MAVSPRGRLIRLIHVAKRDLAMADDAYRQMLQSLVGASSAADLSVAQLDRVLERLKQLGFRAKKAVSQQRFLAEDDQSRMIRGLWLELHGQGVVRDASEAALAAFVHRMTGIDALQWLSTKQASAVIEHLKKWQGRVLPKQG